MAHVSLITGPERRRRWRDDEKLAILAEAFSPGAVVADVARRHDVATSLIYQWRRQAAGPGFVEAMVADEAPLSGGPSPVIQVELAAARVSIAGSASPALVSAVLRALR
ncbi:MAG TPA: transposase [Phenylobacterium sp.]|nr:transposase [Phenylobacterium sp.]